MYLLRMQQTIQNNVGWSAKLSSGLLEPENQKRGWCGLKMLKMLLRMAQMDWSSHMKKEKLRGGENEAWSGVNLGGSAFSFGCPFSVTLDVCSSWLNECLTRTGQWQAWVSVLTLDRRGHLQSPVSMSTSVKWEPHHLPCDFCCCCWWDWENVHNVLMHCRNSLNVSWVWMGLISSGRNLSWFVDCQIPCGSLVADGTLCSSNGWFTYIEAST